MILNTTLCGSRNIVLPAATCGPHLVVGRTSAYWRIEVAPYCDRYSALPVILSQLVIPCCSMRAAKPGGGYVGSSLSVLLPLVSLGFLPIKVFNPRFTLFIHFSILNIFGVVSVPSTCNTLVMLSCKYGWAMFYVHPPLP